MIAIDKSRYSNNLKIISLILQRSNFIFIEKITYSSVSGFWQLWCTTAQLGNYAVKIIKMTLDIRNTAILVKIGVNLS